MLQDVTVHAHLCLEIMSSDTHLEAVWSQRRPSAVLQAWAGLPLVAA